MFSTFTHHSSYLMSHTLCQMCVCVHVHVPDVCVRPYARVCAPDVCVPVCVTMCIGVTLLSRRGKHFNSN